MPPARRYISTPIYYVNDRPHIGHVYSTTLCDAWARFQRSSGADVFFLTGTDEHGKKVETSAAEAGISPRELSDRNAAEFRDVMDALGLTFDEFIRTTDEYHERQVQGFVRRLLACGVIYLGEFEGWYDEGQEEYYTETQARDNDCLSPVSGKPLVRSTEKNYYFRLSSFQSQLEELYASNPGFVRPESRRNEILARLQDGLLDVPISRTNFSWGIPMPDDPEHVIYVWIDALFNYVTALGLGEPGTERSEARAAYWPAEYHVIGKEILWFHAVIWPAILMALELPLPGCIYAHSFWISEGRKMSKSLGNFIDLEAIDRYQEHYGPDAWRYYICTRGPLGATDADFSSTHFHEVYNTDLVNTIGNCASRVTAMVKTYFDGVIPKEFTKEEARIIADHDWPKLAESAVSEACSAMERFDLAGSAGAAVGLIRKIDGFINMTEPYVIAKDADRHDELGTILYQCLEALRIASLLLWPILPGKMQELWNGLGLTVDLSCGATMERSAWGQLEPGGRVIKMALFPRQEPLAS